jgi:hypothetical protein
MTNFGNPPLPICCRNEKLARQKSFKYKALKHIRTIAKKK